MAATTRQDAERAFHHSLTVYRPKYSNAAACLEKDRESLLAFYDFPAEHWIHALVYRVAMEAAERGITLREAVLAETQIVARWNCPAPT